MACIPDHPPAFDVFLEKQEDGTYRIALAPEAVLMRWLPLGFFLTANEARRLADELITYAALAQQPGCVPDLARGHTQ